MPEQLRDDFAAFGGFSLLCLNEQGQFLQPAEGASDLAGATPVLPDALPGFLAKRVTPPPGTTDVFIWVHGWQNDLNRAVSTAKRLFGNLTAAIGRPGTPQSAIKPSFIAVHWPSQSAVTSRGYSTIRDRAAAMTEQGDAEFFLAALLGYLEAKNSRSRSGSKVLLARDGYYVHALGHSFGSRFLTAAIAAAAKPEHARLRPQTLSLLDAVPTGARKTLSARTEKLFAFTVDTACFLQMAAPSSSFSDQLSALVEWSPFRGPLALTYSKHDRANCLWHKTAEGERAVGCIGAKAPADWIGWIVMRPPAETYTDAEFAPRIVNVDASSVYTGGRLRPEGAHSDFWYPETIHLILSLALQARTRPARP